MFSVGPIKINAPTEPDGHRMTRSKFVIWWHSSTAVNRDIDGDDFSYSPRGDVFWLWSERRHEPPCANSAAGHGQAVSKCCPSAGAQLRVKPSCLCHLCFRPSRMDRRDPAKARVWLIRHSLPSLSATSSLPHTSGCLPCPPPPVLPTPQPSFPVRHQKSSPYTSAFLPCPPSQVFLTPQPSFPVRHLMSSQKLSLPSLSASSSLPHNSAFLLCPPPQVFPTPLHLHPRFHFYLGAKIMLQNASTCYTYHNRLRSERCYRNWWLGVLFVWVTNWKYELLVRSSKIKLILEDCMLSNRSNKLDSQSNKNKFLVEYCEIAYTILMALSNQILTSIITKYVDQTAKIIWLYLIKPNEGW